MSKFNGQIVGLTKLANSKNGNPRYKIRVYKFDTTEDFITKTDAGFAYAIDSSWLNKYAHFELNPSGKHLTNVEIEND